MSQVQAQEIRSVNRWVRVNSDIWIDKILNWLRNTWTGRFILAFVLSRIIYQAWPRKSLKNKTVLVTGGGGGIGKELAITLARKGANLVLWDINKASLVAVLAEIEGMKLGTKVHIQVVDVSKPENVYKAAAETKEKAGFVYCLINNAGIVSGRYLLDTPDEAIQRVFSINALAHFWTIKAFLPEMLERNEGHICTIASAAGLVGAAKMADYCASKFAAVGLDESLRSELKRLGKNNVRTTVICPAHVETDLFKGYKPGLFQSSLSPNYVALKIVESIQKNKEVVFMPRVIYLGVFLKTVLPTFLSDLTKDTSGSNQAMDSFKPKPLPQAEP